MRNNITGRNIGGPTHQGEPRASSLSERRGIVGWWLNLTSPPIPTHVLTITERERLRKAELTSFSIIAVFVFLIALVSNSLADPATAQAVGIMAVGLLIAAILNRTGRTRAAAYLIPSLMMLVTIAAILGSELNTILFPAYDLFVLPIFLSSLTGNRRAPWFFAFFAIAFIAIDFAIQPHELITASSPQFGSAVKFDTIVFWTQSFTWWGMINRHVALAFFAGFFGWLGARSVDFAITRADRAEELAELERRELENKRQIETAAQHLLEVHTRVANGDFSTRAALDRGNVLWSVGQSLNNLLQRLQRQGQSEYQLRRTEEEAQRLATALDEVNAGRYPLWPARANTVIDLLIDRVVTRSQQIGRGGHSAQQQHALPPQQRPQAPLPPPGFTPSGPGGQSSFPPPTAPLPGQAPQPGGFPEGWPSLSPAQPPNQQPNQSGERPMQTSDNPWFLPPEGGNW
ncbi:MAG TPA: hypothetical protein VF510_18610 [Ktedonobacterales bacterium]